MRLEVYNAEEKDASPFLEYMEFISSSFDILHMVFLSYSLSLQTPNSTCITLFMISKMYYV